MVVAMRSPYDIGEFEAVKNYVAVYECTPISANSLLQFFKED